ncbi:MAG TPA: long-chain-fatty-acid--CoA ligase [Bacilli bacterium]|nr:long-chain-fatty-acid--CoA ligase [Bacilli bacterium]
MNLSANLRHSAATQPEVSAILFQGQHITYRELDVAVDRFAAGLQALGLRQGSRVGLLLGNCPQFVIAYYAIARLGAVSVPINPLYTPGELQFILADSETEAVVAASPLAPAFQAMGKTLPALQHVIYVGEPVEEGLMFQDVSRADAPTAVEIGEDDLAVILYTSGTTGKPKGALLSQRNMCSNAQNAGDFLGITQTDTVVAVLPMFHVFCMTVCLNAPVYRGATMLVLPRFSPTETAKAVRESQATVFAGVPTMYNFLTQHPECQPDDLRSLRLAISGGAPMPIAVLEGFERKYDVTVSEGYGLSEASPVVTFNPLDAVRKPGTIGVAIPGCEVRVVREDGLDMGPGEVGELICRGPNVMLGYLNRPEDTAHALRDGWLHTGDMATIDEEGYVTIVDRKKDMILVGGFNVYPREVEELLFKHPNVREAAVIGVPDPSYGEAVRAYVALKEDGATTEAELIEFCKQNLTEYKVPKEIELLEELPKNSTGKILRRALRNQESNSVK